MSRLFIVTIIFFVGTINAIYYFQSSELHYSIALSQALCLPSWDHPLGCDATGNDLLHKMISGGVRSITIAIWVVFLKLGFAICFAFICLWSQKTTKELWRSLLNILMSMPGVLMAIFISSLFTPSASTIIFSLAITGWSAPALYFWRLLEAEYNKEYIQSSIAMGSTRLFQIRTHLLPSLAPYIWLQCLQAFIFAIVAEASLSFLGLGGPIHQPSWGLLIAEGREYLVECPRLSLVPGGMLFLLLFALQMVSQRFSKKMKLLG